MIGKRISQYEILKSLGRGGMGEVYLAMDHSLNRKVALKFLPAAAQQDEIARQRLLQEARAAASLDHPFICDISRGKMELRSILQARGSLLHS